MPVKTNIGRVRKAFLEKVLNGLVEIPEWLRNVSIPRLRVCNAARAV